MQDVRDHPIPLARGQAYPRSLRLYPGELLVPSGTLRALFKSKGRLQLLYTGYALEPAIRNGAIVSLQAGRPAGRGSLVLCDVDGWPDLRRAVRRSADGGW